MGTSRNIPVMGNDVPVIQREHKEIHEGEMFHVTYKKAANTSQTLELFVRTSGTRKRMHATFGAQSLLTASWELYEGTSKSYVSDNAITPINRNRGVSATPQGGDLFCHTPSGSGDGTKIAQGFCGGGAGIAAIGAQNRDAHEFILKPSTQYLLRITSNADSNQLVAELDFYEHTEGYAGLLTTTTTTTSSTTTTTA